MKKKELKIYDFTQFYNDIHYVYGFWKKGKLHTISIEPCSKGFCVTLYVTRSRRSHAIEKRCTEERRYSHDVFCKGARHPDTWDKAVKFANELHTEA